MRSTWDARRQLEGLEERTASAVAYLHRQLLDLQAEQSPKISSDVGVRLDALEQKQQQTAHRLDAMADVANSFAKQQEVRLTVCYLLHAHVVVDELLTMQDPELCVAVLQCFPGARATSSSFAGQAASQHMLHPHGSACFL